MTEKLKLANIDFIPYALFELGGVGQFIDVEDLFIRCYELAPERFKWRKYNYPNYKILYKALVDFEERYAKYILKTKDGLSRQLSAEGVEWINQKRSQIWKLLDSPGEKIPTRRPNQRILNDLSKHRIFRIFQKEGEDINLNKFDVSDFLLCSPDSPSDVWKERLETFRSSATQSNRQELVAFLNLIFKRHPEWFGGIKE